MRWLVIVVPQVPTQRYPERVSGGKRERARDLYRERVKEALHVRVVSGPARVRTQSNAEADEPIPTLGGQVLRTAVAVKDQS